MTRRSRSRGARLASTLAAALALAAAPAPAPAVAAPGPAVAAPILGVDPLTQGTAMEDHSCAVRHWVERGIRGAVLLHIDTHDDIRTLPAGAEAALLAARARGDLAALTPAGCGGASALFSEGNFIRAAAVLGIAREVVWVVPFTFLGDDDAGESLRAYLGRAGFSAQERGSFRLTDGFYRGVVAGLPLTVCAQERLPALGEPVLLSLDADFFPYAASYRGLTPLREIRELFAALRAARYPVRDAVLAYSVSGGHLPVGLRWLGEAALEVLRAPDLAWLESPPERWSALQQLGTLRARGPEGDAELMDRVTAFLAKRPRDPAALFLAAEAAARRGGDEAALAWAVEACTVDTGYCAGLREIGLQLLEAGRVTDGAPFFAAAERLVPGMQYGRFDQGYALLRAGRTAEAQAIFEAIDAADGTFPAGFMVGALLLAAGDRAGARARFDRALAALERSPYARVTDPSAAAAVRAAAAFYREAGLALQADRLERDDRMRLPAAGEGP